MAPQRSLSPRAWSELFLLALLWGGSFLAIRTALDEIGVVTSVAHRVFWAAVVLWAYVLIARLPLPRSPTVAIMLKPLPTTMYGDVHDRCLWCSSAVAPTLVCIGFLFPDSLSLFLAPPNALGLGVGLLLPPALSARRSVGLLSIFCCCYWFLLACLLQLS